EEEEEEEDGAGATARSKSGSQNPDDATYPTKKRGQGANSVQSVNKTPKDGGDLTAGDKTRVPEKGQKVQWGNGGDSREGEVEAVYQEKRAGRKTLKGSEEEPQIALKEDNSGKTAIQSPENVKF
ncbi:hypothetical protein DM02DRAFT_227173, partial [Periconia macrospinosa]